MEENVIGQRIRELRKSIGLSQMKLCKIHGKMSQSGLNRYETGVSETPNGILLWYADYFDVSLDYIFGRTDNPQGRLYEYRPRIEQSDPAMEKFVEMCFDPNSPMNERLKETLLQMLREGVA